MRRVSRLAFVVVLVASISVPMVAPVVAQEAGNSSSTATPAPASNSSGAASNYTIQGLRQLGTHPAGAPDSMRPEGDAGAWWLRHVPAALGVSEGAEDARRYVTPNTVVRRNQVYLGSFRGWESEDEKVRVHVVTWRVEEETENGTTVEKQLTDVQEKTVTASLAGGTYDEARIDLPPAYDGEKYVTLWLEGERDRTQWVFRLNSNAATASVPANSQGDLVMFGFVSIFLPFLGTAVGAVVLDRYLLKSAGRGPGVSVLEYGFLGFAALFMGGFVFYNGLIETLAKRPELLGILGGLFVGALAIWAFSDRGEEALFLQFRAAEADMAPDGSGTWHLANRVHTVVERSDGRKVVPRDGWVPFLARAWPFSDAAPLLEFDATNPGARRVTAPKDDLLPEDADDDEGLWSRVRTRFPGDEQEDEYDVIYLVDPTAEHVVDYSEETFRLGLPDLVEWPEDEEEFVAGRFPVPSVAVGKILAGLAFVGVAYLAVTYVTTNTTLGALAAAVALGTLVVTPDAGKANVSLAPAHFDAVVGNMVQVMEGYAERADAETFQRKYHQSEAKRRAQRQRDLERKDVNTFREVVDRLAPDEDGMGGGAERVARNRRDGRTDDADEEEAHA
ncbi:hypothetical protein [Haloplanus aerogenes]|uniref:Uncharacterized protein n=1 Tax=Haloplanus aerogenes TaxID=660522 RepID=A0A3M0CIC7_9EURY|nr:hypothetical protein [Haloplanus aerogenes]AZH26836.1 hypothetical protein DU502_16290 [Haloplanus aerogenes]RMB09072.1 hypothetical protein ATH50_3442 [Haloplanus aerogenes]